MSEKTNKTTPLFSRVALLGIGLIGSSLARAMRERGLVDEIAISTRREETLEKARTLSLGDSYSLDPADAVKGADLVIICAPIRAYADIGQRISCLLYTSPSPRDA